MKLRWFITLWGLLAATSAFAADGASVAEIQSAHDRSLIRDLVEYLRKNPKADDADQAYMAIFDKTIEHDWFADQEDVAKHYLAVHPDGPVRSLARIVATMARAQAGKYDEASATFDKVLATPNLNPTIQQYAQQRKADVAKMKAAAGK